MEDIRRRAVSTAWRNASVCIDPGTEGCKRKKRHTKPCALNRCDAADQCVCSVPPSVCDVSVPPSVCEVSWPPDLPWTPFSSVDLLPPSELSWCELPPLWDELLWPLPCSPPPMYFGPFFEWLLPLSPSVWAANVVTLPVARPAASNAIVAHLL